MKKMSMLLAMSVLAPVVSMGGEQSFASMTWFNEPEVWSVTNATLRMQVTGQSDYWRVSHYGFTVDDGPFLHEAVFFDFSVKHLPDARRLEWLEANKKAKSEE